jgi:IS5 family transposase
VACGSEVGRRARRRPGRLHADKGCHFHRRRAHRERRGIRDRLARRRIAREDRLERRRRVVADRVRHDGVG